MRTNRWRGITMLASLALLAGFAPSAAAEAEPRSMKYVGSVRLAAERGTGSNVSTYGNLTFLTGTASVSGAGVRIVDISNPAQPVHVSTTNGYFATYASAAEARRVGERDVLVVGLLASTGAATSRRGFEIYDITDPAAPRLLSYFAAPVPSLLNIAGSGASGIHLLSAPGGRTHALVTIDFLESLTHVPGTGGTGDLLIVDITVPEDPELIGEWGILDEPAIGSPIQLGDLPFSGGDDVTANASGTRAYVSYYDAGTVILDITDRTNPKFIGRTTFETGEEGNAHTASLVAGGNILVETNSALPFDTTLTSPALPSPVVAAEAVAGFTPRIASLPNATLSGEIVYVGRGCPAGTVSPGAPADPYLADARGKIALVERGGGGTCVNTQKIGRAIQEGAIGFIMFNFEAGGDSLLVMGGVTPAIMSDGTVVPITIPAVFIGRTAGLALRDAGPVLGSITVTFAGFGDLRILSLRDPSEPVLLSRYSSAASLNSELALTGSYGHGTTDAHGSRVYVPASNAGLRVVDVSQPDAPHEVAFWEGAGAPVGVPRHDIRAAKRHGDLILVADANYGLYILEAP